MSSRYMHRSTDFSAGLVEAGLPGFTLCGKLLNFNGAKKRTAPSCTRCEEIAAKKGWKPRR